MKLEWSTTVLGNVTIVGRPMSVMGIRTGYQKDQAKNQLTQAIIYARQMVTETRALVNQSLSTAFELQMGGPASTAVKPVVEAAAQTHFKMPPLSTASAQTWIDLFKHLNQVYLMIGQGIGGHLTLVDIPSSEKDDTNGSVSLTNAHLLDATDPSGLRLAERGRIHINFQWISTRSAHRVARTIIHEASHKFVGARDHAYKHNKPAYAALSIEEARANADSIACFAYYTWKNGAYAVHD